MRKDHQKYVQECLADAIFRKVLDMEVCPYWGCVSLLRCFLADSQGLLTCAGLFSICALMLPWKALSCWEKRQSFCLTFPTWNLHGPLIVKPCYCESRHCPGFLIAFWRPLDYERIFTGLVCLKNPNKNKPVGTCLYMLSEYKICARSYGVSRMELVPTTLPVLSCSLGCVNICRWNANRFNP